MSYTLLSIMLMKRKWVIESGSDKRRVWKKGKAGWGTSADPHSTGVTHFKSSDE
jgi:hypothetical protein